MRTTAIRIKFGFRGIVAAGLSTAALALVAAGCAGSSGSGPATGRTPVSGGTAVFAEQPSDTPNYIFPFTSSSFISLSNLEDFSWLLYRPLYWFGSGTQPAFNASVSLASPPVFSGRTVTINLKHYMWSDGTQVTASDVMFWINMMLAVPQDWGADVPGRVPHQRDQHQGGQPDRAADDDEAVVQHDLVPVQRAKPDHPDAGRLGPDRVRPEPLRHHGERLRGGLRLPRRPVQGPVHVRGLAAVEHRGRAVEAERVQRRRARHVRAEQVLPGPVKARLSAFQEVPFTTDAAEYDVLQSPSGATKINVGYLPTNDAPAKPANATVGSNPLSARGYTLQPWYTWGISYYPLNLQSTNGDHAAIFKQLYFREAMAYMMNQASVISGPLRGYGQLTVGPVGDYPATQYLSAQGKAGDPFPYNPGKAKSLLSGNGWKVTPGGVSTCVKPGTAAGDCGAGVTAGSSLSFNMVYATGLSWVASEMTQLQSNVSSIGVKLSLSPKPFNQVVALGAATAWRPRSRATGTWPTGAWAGRSRRTTTRAARRCSPPARWPTPPGITILRTIR